MIHKKILSSPHALQQLVLLDISFCQSDGYKMESPCGLNFVFSLTVFSQFADYFNFLYGSDSQGSLGSFQEADTVETIFVLILRCYLPFCTHSFHRCVVEFQRLHDMC